MEIKITLHHSFKITPTNLLRMLMDNGCVKKIKKSTDKNVHQNKIFVSRTNNTNIVILSLC